MLDMESWSSSFDSSGTKIRPDVVKMTRYVHISENWNFTKTLVLGGSHVVKHKHWLCT